MWYRYLAELLGFDEQLSAFFVAALPNTNAPALNRASQPSGTAVNRCADFPRILSRMATEGKNDRRGDAWRKKEANSGDIQHHRVNMRRKVGGLLRIQWKLISHGSPVLTQCRWSPRFHARTALTPISVHFAEQQHERSNKLTSVMIPAAWVGKFHVQAGPVSVAL
jgi:hypothetical protein